MSKLLLRDYACVSDHFGDDPFKAYAEYKLKNPKVGPAGRVIAKVPGTNKVLFEKWNKVVVSGSAYLASQNFKINPPIQLPTYNTDLGLDNIVTLSPTELRDRQICLFAMGMDGCGTESSEVYDVDYSKRIEPADLVPFRVVDTSDDSSIDRTLLFGRKTDSANSKYIYYFKGFDTDPVMYQQYIDGTDMDDGVYASDNTTELHTYVEMQMSVKPEECREYFTNSTGILDARVNSISLLIGMPKTSGGYTYYQGLEPFTVLHFPNELLSLSTKGIEFTYQLFY